MKLTTLSEILQAAHWTYLVESEWKERGGIILSAPPASLKTTAVNNLDRQHDVLILSDINVQSIVKLRDDIAMERFRTLVFPEMEKIYQRDQRVAMNVEGHIKMFVEEGFRTASFEDSRIPGTKAKCLVIGAMTPSCVRKHFDRWTDNGFARRFLWCTYTLRGSVIANAIHAWKKIDIESIEILQLKNRTIPYTLTPAESSEIRNMVKHQRGQETPYSLMKKMACVLKAKQAIIRNGNRWMDILEDFATSLTPEGAELTF